MIDALILANDEREIEKGGGDGNEDYETTDNEVLVEVEPCLSPQKRSSSGAQKLLDLVADNAGEGFELMDTNGGGLGEEEALEDLEMEYEPETSLGGNDAPPPQMGPQLLQQTPFTGLSPPQFFAVRLARGFIPV